MVNDMNRENVIISKNMRTLFAFTGLCVLFAWRETRSALNVDSLFKKPQFEQATLSPDGQFIAALYVENDKSTLVTYDISNRKLRKFNVPQGYDIYRYTWASNEHIVYEISTMKNYAFMLGVADREAKHSKDLKGYVATKVIDGLVHDPEHILVWIRPNPDDNTTQDRLLLLNFKTNITKQEVPVPAGRILSWYTDQKGEVRLCAAYRKGNEGVADFYYRLTGSDGWQIARIPEEYDVIGLAQDAGQAYVMTYDAQKTKGLYLYNHGQQFRRLYRDCKRSPLSLLVPVCHQQCRHF